MLDAGWHAPGLKVFAFQKFPPMLIHSTVCGVYDGEVGRDRGTPSGIQPTKSHHKLVSIRVVKTE